MKHAKLHEFAKFCSGLVFADFLYGLWVYTGGFLPFQWQGITFVGHTIIAGMAFDILLFVLLVHYAWYANRRPRTSSEKRFHIVVGILLSAVALLHLSRLVFGWSFLIGSFGLPYWLNAVGFLITAFLAYASFRLAGRRQ